MPASTDCPELDGWQALFDGPAPPDQWERCERHLESCPACQDRLRRAQARGDVLWELGREFGDPTALPADPTLSQYLDQLREATPTFSSFLSHTATEGEGGGAEPADLYFLRPANRPGILGTLGGYEVQGVIGQGGMGVVLKAFEPALHRHVAIKVLAPALAGSATARRRFTREAQAAAAVCHDHVVTVHGVHEVDGLPYLVMQYVPGESLQERLDRTGPLEVAEVVRIGLQAASGLAAAHAQGLIHRDVKPANLLLEGGLARVKITDFGLARTADDVGLTQAGVVAGTPEYMAPEQARGEQVDPRADLFSLGSVLYACCTGLPPFRGVTPLAVLHRVSDQEPAPVRALNPEVPAWLEAFILRLLAKDPAQRFQSAAEVAALLERYLAHLRQPATVSEPKLPPAREEPGPERSPGRASSGVAGWLRWPSWAVMAVVVLTALGLSQWLLGPNLPESGQGPRKEFYQDFRGGQRLHPALNLIGPDADQVSKPEAEGLRIALPATRPVNHPVEVATTFALSGDFEVTGTYELLSADQPVKGYGVGVSLNIADNDDRKTFAKVARAMVVQGGSVFQSEYWTSEPRKDYQVRTKPTGSRVGQLRLVRTGSSLRCLAADGLGGDFEEIFSQDPFVTEDMAHVRFVVADSGTPGNAVDARLVDLKVRATNLIPDPTSGTAAAVEPGGKSGSKGWVAAAGTLVLLILLSLAVWLAVRRLRRTGKAPAPGPEGEARAETAAPPVSFPCPGCGKKLRVKAGLAGKKVKCPQCAQAVTVPGTGAGEAGGTSS
jgi:serine/threonine protein kinase